VRVPARGVLEVSLKATAPAGPGRAGALLAVTTGEVDSPENQVWTVVAEAVP